MTQPTKDLFDESTMTFGEHLEVLRVHLIRAMIGLVIATGFCLYRGAAIVDLIRRPIDRALVHYAEIEVTDDTGAVKGMQEKIREDWGIDVLSELIFGRPEDQQEDVDIVSQDDVHRSEYITVKVDVHELAEILQQTLPEQFPRAQVNTTETPTDEQPLSVAEANAEEEVPRTTVSLKLRAPQFAQFQATVEQARRPVTLNVQEAFLTYIKVSLIAGLILASPWIFYQIWQFVAAGLYPHERKFVYVYGALSLVLFLLGAVFCFYAVFPFVLRFLLGFNSAMEIHPQIRLSEWISFAVILPLMFGISFQLPLVMLFLERIQIFQVHQYREQRRMAILVIAVVSMLLTPADPMSMMLMMIPLCFLYELGIILCGFLPAPSPFDAAERM